MAVQWMLATPLNLIFYFMLNNVQCKNKSSDYKSTIELIHVNSLCT